MIRSFTDSPAFRDHPVASILISGRSQEIIGINKAAKKLFGEGKTSWHKKEVTEFLPGINLKLKNSYSRFVGKGGTATAVTVTSSKVKIANVSYNLIAVHPMCEDGDDLQNNANKFFKENELSNTIINSLPGAFYLIDENGKFLRWNKNFETVTGYSATEIGQMLPTDFFEEGDERELIAERVRKVFIEGEADAEADFLTKTKNKVPHYFTGKLINFEGKNCLIGMGIDVTRRRDAELLIKESENDLRAILNSSVDAMYFIDLEGRVRLVNAAAIVTANVLTKRKISIGDSFLGLLPDQWKESFLSNFQRVLKGEIIEFEREVRIDDGRLMWFHVRYLPVRDEQNKIIGVSNTGTDITMRKVAERALMQSEERFKLLYHQTPAMMHSIDVEGRLIRASDYWLQKMGYSREEVLDKPVTDFFTLESRNKAISEGLPSFFATGKTENGDYDLVTKSGKILNTLLSANGERDALGHIVRSMAVIIDITDQKTAEQKLRANEEYLRSIIDTEPSCVKILNSVGELLEMNASGLKMIEADSLDQIAGQKMLNLVDEPFRKQFAELTRSVIQGNAGSMQFSITGLKGTKSWLETHAVPLKDQRSNQNFLLGITQDITDRKKSEEALLASNSEKDLLIKEIHHRVKNNLQLISSIIYLKMKSIEVSGFKDFLEDTRQKIRSIALIHERLLQTGSVNQVSTTDYFGKLILDLQMTNQRNDLDIVIGHEIDSGNMNLDVAIYCGLIINELVTNSIKHAFADRSKGRIKVELHRNENSFQLIVSDNGNSIPNDIVIGKSGSFGMQLLEIFVKQLKGEMELSRAEGTCFIIKFAYP
jgi:PAS domain S-box-containing protein